MYGVRHQKFMNFRATVSAKSSNSSSNSNNVQRVLCPTFRGRPPKQSLDLDVEM